MDKDDQTIYAPDGLVSMSRRTWKNALLNDRLFYISMSMSRTDVTLGYRIIYYLWSTDIWFGKLPLLKLVLAVNIVVWILQFVL